LYTLYPIFLADADVRTVFADPDDRMRATREVEDLIKRLQDRVTLRGSYSTVGFRADADLMLWFVGPSAEDVQHAFAEFRRTEIGGYLEATWTFMGVVKPAEFSPEHQPAFAKGDAPLDYLCVYPYVRTPEWYLLPPEERSTLLREHGGAGREIPHVVGNTTSAFGLGDWEWILAFESPQLDSIVDVIRLLRGTEARRFTKEEVPFVTGIRKSLAACIDDMC
jgi:chlorite dismutase